MICYLCGTLISVNTDKLVIESNNLGYEVFVSPHILHDLPETGQSIKLYTHDHIREDAHSLYGFLNEHEKNVFQLLISVTGIGPRLGMAILSVLTPDQFIQAVSTHNISLLTEVPGIGRKSAERIMLELKDKIGKLYHIKTVPSSGISQWVDASKEKDVLAALQSLGYNSREAKEALYAGLKETDCQPASVEDIVRFSLKHL